MYGSRLDDQLNQWRAGADINAGSAEEAIDHELSGRIEQIRTTAAYDPADAFAQLVALTSFLNAAAGIRSSIIEKIAKHIDELRQALGVIAGKLGAKSFDIGVNLPVGLSVSVTFGVQAGQ
jgi:hypothetical protein